MQFVGTGSMGVRIGTAVLLGALVPLALLGGLVYAEEADHLRSKALETLTGLANIQEARVEAFERTSLVAAQQVAGRTAVRTELARASAGATMDTASLNRALQESTMASAGVRAVSVTSRDGVVVASTRPAVVGTVAPGTTSLDLSDPTDVVLQLLGPGLPAGRDAETWIGSGPPRLLVSVPVALGGRPVGAAVLEVPIDPLIEIATERGGLGDTGETLLAARTAGGDALFVTALRFDPDAQFSRIVRATETETPITHALDGQERVLADAADYRDEPVLAVTRYLPSSDLGLVVKIDRSEAFGPIRDLVGLLLVGALLAVVVAGFLAWVLARRIAQPVKEVEDVAMRIGRGELDARADTSAPGELGQLATTLNQMATEIAAAQDGLEAQVAARTADLEDKIRQLEHRNEELDAFSSAVAHDLKSPLTVIKGSLDTIRAGRVDDERTATLLGASARAALRMRDLIDDLLVLARTGTGELARDDISLDHLVAATVTALDLEDVVEVEPLPIVAGDRPLLQQAMQNLLDNAATYAGADGAARIRVAAIDVDEDTWAIAVDDNGRGIPADERETVFRPFTRGSTSAGTSGTGVGLAIVARIAERHGGRALAADSPLGGTRMLLVLPRQLVIVEADQQTYV